MLVADVVERHVEQVSQVVVVPGVGRLECECTLVLEHCRVEVAEQRLMRFRCRIEARVEWTRSREATG